MVGTPLRGTRRLWALARGERGTDLVAVAVEIAADEDGLRLVHVGQLHPRELVPPAREVEEALPVAAREADDALGTEHALRQPVEHAREALLIERMTRPVEEAPDAVVMQMVRRRPGPLAVGGDAGREEEVRVDRAAHGV